MATVIVMPRLSPTMEEGVLLKWMKKEGDHVNPGEAIAEVETDKANMDFPLEDEGTLLRLLVKEGETVKLGSPVAVLGDPGEDADAALAEAARATATPAAPKKDESATAAPAIAAATAKATATAAPATSAPTSNAAPTVEERPTLTVAPVAETNHDGPGMRASPLVRKLATERGIDLRLVHGSGPHGRIVARDLEQASAQISSAPVAAPSGSAACAPSPMRITPREGELIPLSPMRKTIARRLTEAKATIPHFYVTMDAAADALYAFHKQLKAEAESSKISLNDLVLKVVALALAAVPEANASYTEQGIRRHGRVDLGIAVSIDDGLVTPVLRDADQKPIGRIAIEAHDLIERARLRKLKTDELSGSTFSVSNMGMYGVKSFNAVINPPEGGILAVGAMEKRAVVVTRPDGSDSIEVRRMMTLTLSSDHRVVDGALAARLLGEIVKGIERPLTMVL